MMHVLILILTIHFVGHCASVALPDEYPLRLTPNHGNMLGGDVVYINGPNFEAGINIQVTFGEYRLDCLTENYTHAICRTPMLYGRGQIIVSYISNSENQHYVGYFYVEDPLSSKPYAWIENVEIYNDITPSQISIRYDPIKLNSKSSYIMLELWGYREVENEIQWRQLYVQRANIDYATIPVFTPDLIKSITKDGYKSTFQMGVFKIASDGTSNFLQYLWTHPIPLGWVFSSYWSTFYQPLDWAQIMCKQWALEDAQNNDVNFSELPCCPTTIEEIKKHSNTFVHDDECNTRYMNATCYSYSRILTCFISKQPPKSGGSQQCCYDANGTLTLDGDVQRKTGHPCRVHPFGSYTYDIAYKVPGFSHWYYDFIPYLKCCKWPQDKKTCEIYKQRRPQSKCQTSE